MGTTAAVMGSGVVAGNNAMMLAYQDGCLYPVEMTGWSIALCVGAGLLMILIPGLIVWWWAKPRID